ncbi:hypothetical protein BRM9_1658 [Methanobacterium formicicum]|uniref:Uncharacterized protein n=1 Tax=Methanobacterium formicicum TaxID=2162 RepID=A0A089ZH02_METFO|nr:hypothetical protein BRM9_1658 [Methanobacterium formicicum]
MIIVFQPIEYATDPDLAGIYIIFDDGVLLQLAVKGTHQFYEVSYYLGEWFVDRAKRFYEKMMCSDGHYNK